MSIAHQLELHDEPVPCPSSDDLESRAKEFCEAAPYRAEPYCRRNWGGVLHSLCSYQGKLKPSIAHFLVSWFTEPGWRVLDPMAGVGTIPLEARLQGRIAIANDLSPLAACVSRAKTEAFEPSDVAKVIDDLRTHITNGPKLGALERQVDLEFGLNGAVREYFHSETLREVVLARRFFLSSSLPTAARDVVLSSLLHILHGNRPYALSRRSHPVTPLAPSGPIDYRPLLGKLTERLKRVVPVLDDLAQRSLPGKTHQQDFRELQLDGVDAVITSPPFAGSFRFWSMNWMRLWFTGWEREDFASEPKRYLETEQRKSFAPYAEFAEGMSQIMRPGGVLVMHLGETSSQNMAEQLIPILNRRFDVIFAGRECVLDTESHGLRDKGATIAHWYVFAVRRS